MLIQAFSILPDPRTGPAQRHDLKEMIVMTLSAVLCGADNWVDVAEWAGDNEDWFKKYLSSSVRLCTPPRAGFFSSGPGGHTVQNLVLAATQCLHGSETKKPNLLGWAFSLISLVPER
ncbi:MAG: transposase family protein [Hydrogenophaga sp.]|nr:transposase family protein [Hydrogenophaga sp.]